MKNIFCMLLTSVIFTGAEFALAQQPAKIPHIGILTTFSPSVISARIDGFRQGLRELGYVEGKNIVIEWRSAEGDKKSFPPLSGGAGGLKVKSILSPWPTATPAFQGANSPLSCSLAQGTVPL